MKINLTDDVLIDLSNQLSNTLKAVNELIEVVNRQADEHEMGLLPTQLRDSNGGFVLTPLLQIKVDTIQAMLDLDGRETNDVHNVHISMVESDV